MTTPSLAKIHSACISAVRFANGMAQSIRIGRHSDQMDVIGHQAVSPDVNTVLPAPMRHQISIGLIVPIIEESLLPPVASTGLCSESRADIQR
jgi:hypothetical protein